MESLDNLDALHSLRQKATGTGLDASRTAVMLPFPHAPFPPCSLAPTPPRKPLLVPDRLHRIQPRRACDLCRHRPHRDRADEEPRAEKRTDADVDVVCEGL